MTPRVAHRARERATFFGVAVIHSTDDPLIEHARYLEETVAYLPGSEPDVGEVADRLADRVVRGLVEDLYVSRLYIWTAPPECYAVERLPTHRAVRRPR